jgi:hypothetical protein
VFSTPNRSPARLSPEDASAILFLRQLSAEGGGGIRFESSEAIRSLEIMLSTSSRQPEFYCVKAEHLALLLRGELQPDQIYE